MAKQLGTSYPQNGGPEPSHFARNLIIVVLLAALLTSVGFGYFVYVRYNFLQHENVIVSGSVATNITNTYPVGLDFFRDGVALQSSETLSGASPAYYSTSLVNDAHFTILVQYAIGNTEDTGNCSGGNLFLNVDSANLTLNISC